MSLVERALKKLQASGVAAAKPSPQLPPREVETFSATEPNLRIPAVTAAVSAPTPKRSVELPQRIVNIDFNALRDLRLLPPANLERRIASQYQHIKRPLVAAALGRNGAGSAMGHLIMLASALPGEGKTFTSINLALSMAREKDLEVVLVDADVAKPHISRLFGIDQERGLIDLLADGDLYPDSVILRTNVPGLSLMSAGRPVETATELIASERMQQLVKLLGGGNSRRVVLFDSPPLLLSTESRALVASMGQVVLIVRAEDTPQNAVLQAIEAIGDGKPVSLILNQSSAALSEGHYGYGSYGDTNIPESTQ